MGGWKTPEQAHAYHLKTRHTAKRIRQKRLAAKRWNKRNPGSRQGETEEARLRRMASARARLDRNRSLITSLKSAPCMDCAGSFPSECMDFDHRPGTKKLKAVAQMSVFRKAWILAEIAKCDLVCANCHRIRTAARRRAM